MVNELTGILATLEIKGADAIFDLSDRGKVRKSDVPVDMEYYILDPGVRFYHDASGRWGFLLLDLLNTAIIKVPRRGGTRC